MGTTSRGINADLAAKLEFLRSLAAFDHVGDCIETHMSYVFLTEHRAFKLKKPARLPYVDQSTVANRRRACENELRLGLRLAASVYEKVAPLVATPQGFAVEGEGEVVDWLLVMRRLAADRMLPAMFARNEATEEDADTIGDLLAGFYAYAPIAPWSGPEYREHLRELVLDVGGELVARGVSSAQVSVIVHEQLAGLVALAGSLDERIAEGRVIDAHGDLRPEHVCVESPPVIIDPLEFDDKLRTLDAASELAFFTLECERLGARWFGDRVFARYCARTEDDVPAALVALYRSQHALTRALLALRHLDDVDPSEHPRWLAKTQGYLARAELPVSTTTSLIERSW